MLLFEDVEARSATDELDRRAEAARKATGYAYIDSVHYLLALSDEYVEKGEKASFVARIWVRFAKNRTKLMTVIVRLPRPYGEPDQPYSQAAIDMKMRALYFARKTIAVVEPIDVLEALMTSPKGNMARLLKALHIEARDVKAAIHE